MLCSRTLHNDGLKLGRDIKINFNAWIDWALFTKCVIAIARVCVCVCNSRCHSTHITHIELRMHYVIFSEILRLENIGWRTYVIDKNVRPLFCCAHMQIRYEHFVDATRSFITQLDIAHVYCVPAQVRAFCRTPFPLLWNLPPLQLSTAQVLFSQLSGRTEFINGVEELTWNGTLY